MDTKAPPYQDPKTGWPPQQGVPMQQVPQLGTYAPGAFAPGTYAPGTYAPGTYVPGTVLQQPQGMQPVMQGPQGQPIMMAMPGQMLTERPTPTYCPMAADHRHRERAECGMVGVLVGVIGCLVTCLPCFFIATCVDKKITCTECYYVIQRGWGG